MTKLKWEGKYKDGKKVAPVSVFPYNSKLTL